MDSLTHTAVGLFLSRAGLNRWTPRAAAILFLAANAPDIDILALAGGPLNYLHYHRHLTHSLVAMPVIALLVVLAVRWVPGRRGRKPIAWWGAFGAAMIAVASHLALDLTNPYGVRLFLPFSAQWVRLDLTAIVDLWIWAVVLLAIAGPFLGRLVGAEIASKPSKPSHYGRGFAVFALVFLLLYNCGRAVLNARAAAVLEARLYGGSPPLRAAAIPGFADPLRWRGVVETSDAYAVAEVDLTGEFDAERAALYAKAPRGPAIEAARRTPTFQEFLRFAQFPLWRVVPAAEPQNGTLVEAMDLRFGSPAAPAFVASAVLDANRKVISTAFQFRR